MSDVTHADKLADNLHHVYSTSYVVELVLRMRVEEVVIILTHRDEPCVVLIWPVGRTLQELAPVGQGLLCHRGIGLAQLAEIVGKCRQLYSNSIARYEVHA